MATRPDVQSKRMLASEQRRQGARRATEKRLAAAAYEARAQRIMQSCYVMHAEASHLYAKAAALRRESDPESI